MIPVGLRAMMLAVYCQDSNAAIFQARPQFAVDYVTLVSADQRPEGSEDQRLFVKLTRQDSKGSDVQ